MHTMPLQAPPRVSGASLCALAPQHLCLFGGRDSISGDTLGATRLVSVRSGVAVWDVLTSKTHPPARCYRLAELVTATVRATIGRAREDCCPICGVPPSPSRLRRAPPPLEAPRAGHVCPRPR